MHRIEASAAGVAAADTLATPGASIPVSFNEALMAQVLPHRGYPTPAGLHESLPAFVFGYLASVFTAFPT